MSELERPPSFDLWQTSASKAAEVASGINDIVHKASNDAVVTVKIRVGDLTQAANTHDVIRMAGYVHLREADGMEGVIKDLWRGGEPNKPAESSLAATLRGFQLSLNEVKLIRSGKKIQAIKACRERTGKGLKDAKEDIEAATIVLRQMDLENESATTPF